MERTKEEKAFGIQLDSLVDVISFIAFPIIILIKVESNIYYLPVLIIYSIFGVARLAHYNINTANEKKVVKYYEGLPVTFSSLIFPLCFLLSYLMKENIFIITYNIIAFLVAILFILKIKVPKPNLVSSIILLIMSLVVTIIYLVI